MYQKLKNLIFTLLLSLLVFRLFFELGDPVATGHSLEGALPIYKGWRPLIDLVYTATSYYMLPAAWLLDILSGFFKTNWFPVMETRIVGEWLLKTATGPGMDFAKPLTASLTEDKMNTLFAGVFHWAIPLTMLFLSILNKIIDPVYEFFKNLIWNVLIEMSFTKKKQAVYQNALEKRAHDLMRLNAEYRSLSKEASELKTSVITDELTKVYNKRFFIEKIRQSFDDAKSHKAVLSLIMMDIDHFKRLNDTYGHLMGDVVLKAVAQVAKQATPNDCFCCRFGGEEFCVIMPGKSDVEAAQIAEIIKNSVPLLRFKEHPDLQVTISQGVCRANFGTEAAQALGKFDDFIKLADDELYRAKLEGRNRICTKLVP